MKTEILIKNGLEANRAKVTPKVGELLWTTDQHKLFMGDGATAGGIDFISAAILKSPASAQAIKNKAAIATNTASVATHKTAIATNTAAIAKNTAKAGITPAQATAITANTAKVGITPAQVTAITANTGKVGITAAQIAAITANTAKHGVTSAQAAAITANTAKKGITAGQTAAITANTAKLTKALLKDGSVEIDAAFKPSKPGDVIPFKTLDSFMGEDHAPITNINQITKVGIYHGGTTNPTDHSKDVKVVGTPAHDVNGACMIMASEDHHGNFGYFCMGDSGILYTGGRPKGGTSVKWSSATLGTGKTVLLQAYAKPSAGGAIGATDSVQVALGKLDAGLSAATAGGGDVNVQADWSVGDVHSDAFIKNKPVIANSLTVTVSGSILDARQGKILSDLIKANKGVQADWNAKDAAHGAILHKPDLTVMDGGSF